jgi:intracellular septation protein
MIKLLVEFGPVIVFLVTYKYSNILMATKLMIAVTILCLIISYIIDKRISMPLLLSAIILIVTGSVTLLTGDPKYIKMKPTIVYLIFSLALYVSTLKNRPLMKDILGNLFVMDNKHWINLSTRFAGYFLFMALTNEIVWRYFSESTWVNFKVFGALPITVIFVLLQVPFILRNQITDH